MAEKHECDKGQEIDRLHEKMDRVIQRLGGGDGRFNTIQHTLDALVDQVKTTNGRVKNLELWKARLLGVVIGLGIINTPVVLFVLAYAVKCYFGR